MSLPSKYRNLLAAAEIAVVPVTELLDEPFFRAHIANYAALNADIDRLLDQITATSGAFIDEHLAELARLLEGVVWQDSVLGRLSALLTDRHCGPDARLAVRSAALSEDTALHSYAGLYRSLLNVHASPEAVADAVRKVWLSYFDRAAINERLNRGSLNDGLRMNVMVQRMVDAAYAGVAFSIAPQGDGGAQLEYVHGIGDALVSGRATAIHVEEECLNEAPEADRAVCERVFALIRRLKALFVCDVDVEWAHDAEQLYLLQVRPITTQSGAVLTDGPVLEAYDLFGMSESELERVRPLPTFAEYFRSKRGPLFAFGKDEGIAAGAARLLLLNREAMLTPGNVDAIAAHFAGPQVVLDINDRVRQVVVNKSQLGESLLNAITHPNQLYRILVRDYIKGDVGLISRMTDSGAVVVEYTPDGLLALNRGSAVASILVVGGEDTAAHPFDTASIERLAHVTPHAQARFGRVQLEWVYAHGTLYLIDVSPLSDVALPIVSIEGASVVSVGCAMGPVCHISDSAELIELSDGPAVSLSGIPDPKKMGQTFEAIMERVKTYAQPPVITVSRPYAALAPLLPHVAGFVFSDAAMLCHLAILLREHGVPAVASPELFDSLDEGMLYTLDAKPRDVIARP
ncbi:PEP/pyruvate-binding domain-containing protein [Paraburkholderia megapolitana]|uniref:PEP/pyruvate-binding domain-containing protein n=1 Tax=Paraburkholderia megapolitana TaxID=420953 RepID=UPI0038B8C01E